MHCIYTLHARPYLWAAAFAAAAARVKKVRPTREMASSSLSPSGQGSAEQDIREARG